MENVRVPNLVCNGKCDRCEWSYQQELFDFGEAAKIYCINSKNHKKNSEKSSQKKKDTKKESI